MEFFLKIILIELLFQIQSINCQNLTNSYNILYQYTYYNGNYEFNNSFFDFINYKVYEINKNNIIRKNRDNLNFHLKWQINDKNKLLIKCVNETCLDIELSYHKVISFDFDRLLSTDGGILAYIFIIYGLFSLKRGYIYFNLSFIFYGSFSFLFFIREICQILQIEGNLNTLHANSKSVVCLVFYSTWIISILYGFVCLFSNYLKYISLGFIEGTIFSKIIFYFLIFLKIINNNLILPYLLILSICSIICIFILCYLKNKYHKFNIINIALIGGFVIIFGINIINGGLPFIPYLILSSKYQEKSLYNNLIDNNKIGYYTFLFLILIVCGLYWNNSSYNKLKNKKIKSK